MTLLDAREGYRRWAPSYEGETAISYLDDELVCALTPPLAGKRLLDAGCGTGRRLRGIEAAKAVGVDLSPDMLAAGAGLQPRHVQTLIGDVRALPLPDAAFDVVWCRLVIGHLPDCAKAYAELGRVAAPGATVIVTDFHAAAWSAGHRRTFRDPEGVHEVEHHVHDMRTQIAAAREAGLIIEAVSDAPIGPSVRDFYDRAGRIDLYADHAGLPVVLALSFRRGA
jgi:malonyl-CoA O-methyltransferase